MGRLPFCRMALVWVSLFAVSAPAAIKWKYVRVPSAKLTREFVNRHDFIRDHLVDNTYAFGYVRAERQSPSDLQRQEMVELDAYQWSRNRFDFKTLLPIARPNPEEALFGPFEEYHTYASLTAELKRLAERFPNLVKLESVGKSVEGRDLWMMRISAAEVDDANKPKLLFISSMHGDEVVGKELTIYLIREMLAKYGTDNRITHLLRYAELFIMPSMNPDGTERHQRFNADGVDLNRDFPDLNEPEFSTSGRAIETKQIMELHRKHHFLTALNFHGGAVCVNIPWDSKPNPPSGLFPDNTLMWSLAREYADLNRPMHDVHMGSFNHGVTYGYEWYQVLGGMQDWASHFRGSTHATVELSDIKWPSASDLPSKWGDNRDSLLTYFERGLDGIHLRVVDEQGNLVQGVSVEISSAKRALKYDGFVHRPTVAGVQQVTLKAAGFSSQALSVNPLRFDGTYQTVVMRK